MKIVSFFDYWDGPLTGLARDGDELVWFEINWHESRDSWRDIELSSCDNVPQEIEQQNLGACNGYARTNHFKLDFDADENEWYVNGLRKFNIYTIPSQEAARLMHAEPQPGKVTRPTHKQFKCIVDEDQLEK